MIFTNSHVVLMAEILSELYGGIKEKDSLAIRKLKTYYQNCMNKTNIEEEGDEILLHILNKIGGWPVLLGDKWNENDYDLMNIIYKIMQENLTLFFQIQLGVVDTASRRKILSVDGNKTQNENIADNGGFKMAYYAYQTWVKSNNIVEDCLSSVNYTPQQLFWISAAKNWCNALTKEMAHILMLIDTHSPFQARVINSFSNIKEFADDFQCKKGSRMNPEKRCIVW